MAYIITCNGRFIKADIIAIMLQSLIYNLRSAESLVLPSRVNESRLILFSAVLVFLKVASTLVLRDCAILSPLSMLRAVDINSCSI